MKRVVITAMLALLAVGVWAGPARAAVDIHIGIPGVVIVPPSDHYAYPRYVYPDSEPRDNYYKHYRRWHHHRYGHHHGRGHHHHGRGHHHGGYGYYHHGHGR
jgi:hypothetical protein